MAEKAVEMPSDNRARPIQVLAPDATATLTVTGTSSRVAIPAGTEICMLSATQAAWVVFGNGSVDAVVGTTPSFLLPAGGVSVRVPDGVTHIAAIQNDTAGKVCLTKLV